MSKVSILIPCYNVEAFLPQCLESVLGQTYQDLQVVLVDDGSEDETLSVAQGYAVKDSRIEVYHQENQGVAAARNALLSKINGEYFLFIDSDDWVEPNMVEFLISRAKKNNADIVTCGMVWNDIKPSSVFVEETWCQEIAVKEFIRHVSFSGSLWNKFFSVRLLHNHPHFLREISYGEDALFCWELLNEAKSMEVTDCQLYHHRVNNAGISNSKWTPDKKGSGHLVWKRISEDVARLYPQYIDMANARYAIEDMWGIYYAMLSNYPYDIHIVERQRNIKKYFLSIKHSGLINRNKIIFCWICSRWYCLGGLLRIMNK